GDGERLGRRLAERGVRDVFLVAGDRALSRTRRVSGADEAEEAGDFSRGEVHAGCGRGADEGVERDSEPDRVSEGRMGAAYAARASGDGEVLGGDSRVLPAVSRRECVDGGFRAGDGGDVGAGFEVVLRSVGEARGVACGGGDLVVGRKGEEGGGGVGADGGGSGLPAADGDRGGFEGGER